MWQKSNLLYQNGVDLSKHEESGISDLMNETITAV